MKLQIEVEIIHLMQHVRAKRKLNAVELTPTLDSIMESRNERYALAFIASGFGRKKGNYGGQVAKGVGLGILTLGLYAPVPGKSNLSIFALVLDSQ